MIKDVDRFYRPESTELVNNQNSRWVNQEHREKQENYVKEYNPNLIVNNYLDGTEEHIDVTPEKWRYRFHHSTGTGWEILKDGTLHRHTSGNSYEYIKGSHSSTIDGNRDHKTEGNSRENVSGGKEVGIKQDHSMYVGGSYAQLTVGNHNVVAKQAMTMASEQSVTLSSQGAGQSEAPVRISLGKDGTVYVTGSKHIVFKATEDYMIEAPKVGFKCKSFNIEAEEDIQMKASGDFNMEGEGEINLKSGANLNAEGGGDVNHKAGGNMSVSGGQLTMNPVILDEDGNYKIPVQGDAGSATDASPEFTDHMPEEKQGVSTGASPGIGAVANG